MYFYRSKENMPAFKYFYLVISILYLGSLSAQPIVGIANTTVQVSPSYTLISGSTFSVSGSVVNTGTTTISNTIHVHMAIDTSTTSTPKYYLRSTRSYSVTNFLLLQTLAFSVSDVANNANGYKVNGGGTTVVIWAVVGFPTNDTTTYDSVKTSIYVLPLPQNIHHLEELNRFLNEVPNPINQPILFTNSNSWSVEIVDVRGKVVALKNSILTPSDFVNGCYLLKFKNERGFIISKKVIINNQ